MAKKITFINEKGGIGKTSICFNVAWQLSKTRKVLMVDMDGQRANLTYFCGIKKPDDLITTADVLKKGKPVKEAIKNVKENLDIVPAAVDVSDISQSVKVKRMREALEEVSSDYDYIFIDVSPSPDWRHYLSLSVSNYALLIMLPDMTSLESDNGILESIEEVKDTSNSNLEVLGIVFNRNEERSNMGKQVKKISQQFAEKLNTKVFESKVRNAVALGEVAYAHVGITDYDPKSPVAADITSLTEEIKREVEKNGKK